jgi:hypothetical protein
MIICGIDPGFSGGISIFNDTNLIDCIIMPIEEKENGKNKINGKELSNYLKTNKVELVYLEHVHAFAGQGRTSIWNFGEGVGVVKGVCECLGIEYKEISPQKWKKNVLGEKYIHDEKSGAIDFVKDTYPTMNLLKSARCKVPHDGKADSICIGHYGTITINNVK